MKFIFLLVSLCLIVRLCAVEYRGDGAYQFSREETTKFTWKLSIDFDDLKPRTYSSEMPPSDLSAIIAIGEIELDFGLTQKFPFYVTQIGSRDGGFSTTGFYITNGYPHVLTIDVWDDPISFKLFENYRSPKEVLTGTAEITSN